MIICFVLDMHVETDRCGYESEPKYLYEQSGQIYSYNRDLKGMKEGNVLFNDALNTFYLWVYGIRPLR